MNFKSLLIVFLFTTTTSSTIAQEVKKGDKIINLTIGFGDALKISNSVPSSIPPIAGSFEAVLKDGLFSGKGAIGVGGYLGYASDKYESNVSGDNYGGKFNHVVLGPTGYLHYKLLNNLDTYAGVMLGYWIYSFKYNGPNLPQFNQNYGGGFLAGSLGARYYFMDKFAGLVELSSGIAYLNLGIAIKL